ncbi:nicotinamide-nucleotide amidohydrolase family protein, partial [Corallococcus praedator]
MGESFLAQKIASIEQELPSSISLAYLPSPMAVNLRLSGNTSNQNEIGAYGQRIAHELADYVYGFSTTSIEEYIYLKLKERKQKLVLIESCTGGYLSNAMTNIKGSSEVFLGGWNVYSDAFKHMQVGVAQEILDNYSSVSIECGKELLLLALKKTNADFGISV